MSLTYREKKRWEMRDKQEKACRMGSSWKQQTCSVTCCLRCGQTNRLPRPAAAAALRPSQEARTQSVRCAAPL